MRGSSAVRARVCPARVYRVLGESGDVYCSRIRVVTYSGRAGLLCVLYRVRARACVFVLYTTSRSYLPCPSSAVSLASGGRESRLAAVGLPPRERCSRRRNPWAKTSD